MSVQAWPPSIMSMTCCRWPRARFSRLTIPGWVACRSGCVIGGLYPPGGDIGRQQEAGAWAKRRLAGLPAMLPELTSNSELSTIFTMRTARRLIAAMLGVLWLMPSLAVCVLGFHLVLEHHAADRHTADRYAPDHHHDHDDHGETGHVSAMTEVAFHGHHHEQTDAADHSHHVSFSTAKLSQRASFFVAASSPAVVSSFVSSSVSLALSRPRADFGQTSERRASPPLFTAHCSLLI